MAVAIGVLSSEHTPVASPQLQLMSASPNHQHQRSPRNSIGKYSRRKNHSPGNSSGSEETIRVWMYTKFDLINYMYSEFLWWILSICDLVKNVNGSRECCTKHFVN